MTHAPALSSLLDRVRALDSAALLTAWETGLGQGNAERALTLLGCALPGTPRAELDELPIGQRDALLLELRERSFGAIATCIVNCPSCEEALEFEVRLNELRAESPNESSSVVEFDGMSLRVRAASSRDLIAASRERDVRRAAEALLERCVSGFGEHDVRDVPSHAFEAIAREMARLDPQADVRLELHCVACGSVCSSSFDVVSYLWREVEAEARRLFREVDALARCYAWSEAEILGLSPARRAAYLKLVSS